MNGLLRLLLLLILLFFFFAISAQKTNLYENFGRLDFNKDLKEARKLVSDIYESKDKKSLIELEKTIEVLRHKGKTDQSEVLKLLSGFQDYSVLNDSSNALRKFRESYHYFISVKNFRFAVKAVLGMCAIYSDNAENERAMTLYFNTVKYLDNYPTEKFYLFSEIAALYKKNENSIQAFDYFKKALSVYNTIKFPNEDDENKLNLNYRYIGVLYRNNKSYDSAEKYFIIAAKGADKLKNEFQQSSILNSLALMYEQTGKTEKAEETYLKSIELKRKLKGKEAGIATSLNNLSTIYMKENKLDKAYKCLAESELISRKVSEKKLRMEVLNHLKKYYTLKKDKQNLNVVLIELTELLETIYKTDQVEQIAKMEAVYQNEKKSKEINEANLKNKALQNDIDYKNRERNIFLIGTAILLALLFVAIRMYMEVRKGNKALNAKNAEINTQKTIVEHQNKEIIDSINYAQKIQEALLPTTQDLNNMLGDGFLFFKPKDIVSGDFYWCCEKGGFVFYATVDCTGHGVPGGFMSMLATSLLAEIIIEKSILEPAEILNQLKLRVITSLKQKGASGENKDGMDMSLCRIDKNKTELVVSAANNPVWLLRNNEMIVLEANKIPVGFSHSTNKFFTQQKISIQKNDIIYTFTDGYADQFGGPKGKKFKYKQLMEYLLSISSHSMEKQKELISKKYEDWKGPVEQVDDICLIGVKI